MDRCPKMLCSEICFWCSNRCMIRFLLATWMLALLDGFNVPPLRPVDTISSVTTWPPRLVTSLALPFVLLFPPTPTLAPPAQASSYAALTAPQKKVAEGWRLLDSTYVDRSFNGLDWYAVRESAIADAKTYKTVDDSYDALSRMAGRLNDKYTVVLKPDVYKEIVRSAEGSSGGRKVVGVGVELRKTDGGGVAVNDAEFGAPAATGGVKRGDVFKEVGGKSTDGLQPSQVADLLRGEPMTTVKVVVERAGAEKSFDIVRKEFSVNPVRSYVSEAKIDGKKTGIVRVKNFSGITADKVKEEMESLTKKGAEGILIDLRGNPGGLLPGGTDTAALFLPTATKTVTVYTRKATDVQKTYTDGPFAASSDSPTPLVLLVDSSTASAAEVMTGALVDNNRASVVGETTFGKGVIQTIRGMRENDEEGQDAGGMKVTIARYETPSGFDLNKVGIKPDYNVGACDEEDAGVCVPKNFKFKQVE